MSHSIRRRIATLALGALLAVPWAVRAGERHPAAPRGAQAAAPVPAGLLGRLWGSLEALWSEAGCTVDPDGARCASHAQGAGTPVSPAPAGCTIDPNGGGCSR